MSLPNKSPKHTRSLGLRKTGLRSKTSTITKAADNIKTPSTSRSTPAIKSKSATKQKETTPITKKSPSKAVSQSAPSNFTPYRLSLNKRLRETMTKKRLEFHIAQEREKSQTSLSLEVEALTMNDNRSGTNNRSPNQASLPKKISTPTTSHSNTMEIDDLSIDSKNTNTQKRRKLIQQIEIVEEEMQARQRHISKTQELQGEIDRWRNTFHRAINDLQHNIVPYQTKLMLANSLGIAENLLPIDNEDN